MTAPVNPEGQTASEHELKCWPEFFEKLLSGEKTFEARKDDRGYRAGDRLRLREWGEKRRYTGREILADVTYLMTGFGVAPGYVVMAIRPLAQAACTKALLQYQERAIAAEVEVARLTKELEEARATAEQARREFQAAWDTGVDLNTKRLAAEAQAKALREALTDLVAVIEKAGLLNLSNGVQLGQTSWFVKASDAVEFAKRALAPAEPKAETPAETAGRKEGP